MTRSLGTKFLPSYPHKNIFVKIDRRNYYKSNIGAITTLKMIVEGSSASIKYYNLQMNISCNDTSANNAIKGIAKQ